MNARIQSQKLYLSHPTLLQYSSQGVGKVCHILWAQHCVVSTLYIMEANISTDKVLPSRESGLDPIFSVLSNMA